MGADVTQYEDLRRWYPALPAVDEVPDRSASADDSSAMDAPRATADQAQLVAPRGEFTGGWADWLSDEAVADESEELGVVRPIRPSVAVPSQSGTARRRARVRTVLVTLLAAALLVAAGALALHLLQARDVPSRSLSATG